jgi:hypothetical protein
MNWLGDSKPKFPAKISEILYARFDAHPILGTVSVYSRLITLPPLQALKRSPRGNQAPHPSVGCSK